MIKQFNLLDKVWYVNDINTKEVTITSHIYLNDICEKGSLSMYYGYTKASYF